MKLTNLAVTQGCVRNSYTVSLWTPDSSLLTWVMEKKYNADTWICNRKFSDYLQCNFLIDECVNWAHEMSLSSMSLN